MTTRRHYDAPGADLRPIWASVTGQLEAVAAKRKLRGLTARRSAEAHRRLAEADTNRIARKEPHHA